MGGVKNKTVVNKTKSIREMTDEELAEELVSSKNYLEYLEDHVGHVESEIFYRKNPKLRPKD